MSKCIRAYIHPYMWYADVHMGLKVLGGVSQESTHLCTRGVQGSTCVCPAPPGHCRRAGPRAGASRGAAGGRHLRVPVPRPRGGGQPTGPRLFLGNFAAFISVQIKAVIAGEMILIGV